MDANFVQNLLDVDVVSGSAKWRERPISMFKSERDMKKWNTRYAGAEAFTSVNTNGYRRGTILWRSFYLHQIVYLVANGELPEGNQIDHINGDRLDNRAKNLRAVSHSGNCRNQNCAVKSSTGFRGVHYVKRNGTYQARIRLGDKSHTLGGFLTAEDAALGRKELEEKHWGKS
jgi:hypothetical protein